MQASTLNLIFACSLLGLMMTVDSGAETLRYRQSGDWMEVSDGTTNGWMVNPNLPGTAVPGPADRARINFANNTVTLAGDAGTISRLYIGVDEPGNLVINPGGVLTASARSGIGDGGATTGSLTINGGSLLISSERWDMGVTTNAHTATVTINSGSMRVNAPYNQNKTTTNATTVINGGELRINSLVLTTGVMNVNGGTLKVVNLTEATINGWIADGLLRFSGETGGVKDINYSLTPFQNGFEIKAIQSPATFQLIITPNGAGFDFEWESQAGKVYDLLTAIDLATPIATWPVYNDGETLHENIPAAGTTTTLTAVPGDGAKRFFAVVEKDAPPLLAEDFEAVTPPGPPTGWVRSDNGAGTAWQVGSPSGAATGPDSAANGTQCAGTNIGSGYTAAAEASLITKAFTVPGSGATLNFSQYIDTENAPSGDLGSIRLLNASDNSVLAGGDVVTALEGVTEAWSRETIPLPVAANGRDVKLEFRFVSNASSEFAGFYIDDLVVTGN